MHHSYAAISVGTGVHSWLRVQDDYYLHTVFSNSGPRQDSSSECGTGFVCSVFVKCMLYLPVREANAFKDLDQRNLMNGTGPITVQSRLREAGHLRDCWHPFDSVPEMRDSLASPEPQPQWPSLGKALLLQLLTLPNCHEPNGLSWGARPGANRVILSPR